MTHESCYLNEWRILILDNPKGAAWCPICSHLCYMLKPIICNHHERRKREIIFLGPKQHDLQCKKERDKWKYGSLRFSVWKSCVKKGWYWKRIAMKPSMLELGNLRNRELIAVFGAFFFETFRLSSRLSNREWE